MNTHRTWVISPDVQTLEKRWETLQREKEQNKKEVLFILTARGKTRARYIGKTISDGLGGFPTRPVSIERDDKPLLTPIRYAFRSFDRQWLPPDIRLLSRPRPELWSEYSHKQVYLTCLEAHAPENGPAITFTGLIPDNDHYKGSFGGRVYPLWRDGDATQANIKPALLCYSAKAYGQRVTPEDVVAYLAAVMAHPAFTARFKADLVRPGLHVPVTACRAVFTEAVALGAQVIWLHCYGERYVDPKAGRPKRAPRLPKASAPINSGGRGDSVCTRTAARYDGL